MKRLWQCSGTVMLACVSFLQGGCDTGDEQYDLAQDPGQWGIYTEHGGIGEVSAASSPSKSGTSLRCSHKGGGSYSFVHCYRNLESDARATKFVLNMSFLMPSTTYNNQGSPSLVQALEFSMSQWREGRRFEWALQWHNVGEGAPQWRFWDPQRTWVALNLPAILSGDEWHTIRIVGHVDGERLRYEDFTLDGHAEGVHVTVDSADAPNEPDKLAIAIQLDSNREGTAFEVYIDEVYFEHTS